MWISKNLWETHQKQVVDYTRQVNELSEDNSKLRNEIAGLRKEIAEKDKELADLTAPPSQSGSEMWNINDFILTIR